MTGDALHGVRVLDVATLYPAPLLAAMLGDLGADVVKVEPPDGDPLRAMGAGPWSIAGRNKRSLVADAETADGRAQLHALIAVADVVVFNQPDHVLARWDCTNAALTRRSPGLIVVRVSCFGDVGVYAGRVGNGTLAEAFVGLPRDMGVPLGDTVGAMQGVSTVLAALFRRERDGARTGGVVEIALYEALLPLVAPRRAGVRAGGMVRARYAAGDGVEVAVSATTTAQVDRLRELTGSDVAAWVAARPGVTALDLLFGARVPAVIVNDIERVAGDATTGAAPALGQHTAAVVEEWLHGGTA